MNFTRMNLTRNYSKVMKAFSFLYGALAVLFYFFHGVLTSLLQIESSPNHFWVVLTASMLVMLSYLSWLAAKAPQNRSYVRVLIASKVTSTVGFLLAFLIDAHLWGYVLSAATDGAIAVFLIFLTRKVHG